MEAHKYLDQIKSYPRAEIIIEHTECLSGNMSIMTIIVYLLDKEKLFLTLSNLHTYL